MSAFKEAITAIRDAMKLTEDIKRTGESLKALAGEVKDHEKRIIRLETKWETAIEFANINKNRLSN